VGLHGIDNTFLYNLQQLDSMEQYPIETYAVPNTDENRKKYDPAFYGLARAPRGNAVHLASYSDAQHVHDGRPRICRQLRSLRKPLPLPLRHGFDAITCKICRKNAIKAGLLRE
jgi:hypothetical protein